MEGNCPPPTDPRVGSWADVPCDGLKVGDALVPGSPSGPIDTNGLVRMLGDADILIDATADIGVAKLLNRVSLNERIPLGAGIRFGGRLGWRGGQVRTTEDRLPSRYLWEVADGKRKVSQQGDAEPIFTRGCGSQALLAPGLTP